MAYQRGEENEQGKGGKVKKSYAFALFFDN
jgi:hypothetical protein